MLSQMLELVPNSLLIDEWDKSFTPSKNKIIRRNYLFFG